MRRTWPKTKPLACQRPGEHIYYYSEYADRDLPIPQDGGETEGDNFEGSRQEASEKEAAQKENPTPGTNPQKSPSPKRMPTPQPSPQKTPMPPRKDAEKAPTPTKTPTPSKSNLEAEKNLEGAAGETETNTEKNPNLERIPTSNQAASCREKTPEPQELTLQDLEKLAQDDPVAALRRFTTRRSATSGSKTQQSSVNTDPKQISPQVEDMLKKIRTLAFGRDLIESIQNHPEVIQEIKELISKLRDHQTDPPVPGEVFELQTLIEELQASFDQQRSVEKSLMNKQQTIDQHQSFLDKINKELADLEEVEKESILNLSVVQDKIKKLKQEEAFLNQNIPIVQGRKLAKATEAVKPMKEVLALEVAINQVIQDQDAVTERIKRLKGRYSPMRRNPPF